MNNKKKRLFLTGAGGNTIILALIGARTNVLHQASGRTNKEMVTAVTVKTITAMSQII